MTTIAIIGAGNVGAALGRNWGAKGHKIVFGVRDPSAEKVTSLLAEIGAAASAASPAEAAAAAEAVVFAVPWMAAEEAVKSLGDLGGKLLMDATNPLVMGPDGLGLEIGHTTSGGERVAEWAASAKVVKTLNQIGAEAMADPTTLSAAPVMFVAGDDEAAKAQAAALVGDLGFDVQDAGDLRAGRLLEAFAMTWIHMALFRGMGRDWGFSVARKTP